MENKNKILVVAAHPDDEVLGAGGTIAKAAKAGDEVFVLILGDGESSRGQENLENRLAVKNQASHKAGRLLGVKEIFFESLPDNQFDSLPLLSIVKTIEKHLIIVKPNVVFTHHSGDLNIDHQRTFQAVLTACRPQPGFFVKKIMSFEVLSSTEWQAKNPGSIFCPNVYNDISDFLGLKIKALECYQTELKDFPHPRSVEGVRTLAQYRGMESGLKLAEAFQLIREIND